MNLNDRNIKSTLDQINLIRVYHQDNFKQVCENILIGRKIKPKYNLEASSRIFQIDWSATPKSMGPDPAVTEKEDLWMNDSRSFSLLEEIEKKYGTEYKVKNMDQPILVVKLDNGGWSRLVPELCEPSYEEA